MKHHVFAGYDYYPCGGTRDHVNSFDDLQEAIEWAKQQVDSRKYDWWHVVEAYGLNILAEG